MLMRSATIIVFFLGVLACAAQSQSVYLFQRDDSLLKKTYFEQSEKKKNALLASLEKKNAADYKKIYEEQFTEIGKLWQSSRSVTSPAAHGYLQSLVQKIISSNAELANNDARVVFSRDWWPNAYSMGDGTIAINAGLMVYLNSEAELVFVLCHELAHYFLDHTNKAIQKYVEAINSDAFQSELKRLSKTEYGVNRQLEELTRTFAFSSRRHSRENESAADKLAFSFMKKTGYDCNAIKSCLELLDKVDDSLFYAEPDIQELLNFPAYPFKKKWIQKESSIFSEMDSNANYDEKKEKDSLKTHPDCSKRISLLKDSIQSISSAGQKFLIDEALFNGLKKDFLIEMTEQCYRDNNLSRNLYYSLLLLQTKENIPVAVYSVARNLNTIYELQKKHQLGSKKDTEQKNYSEEYNVLLRMVEKLRLDEIAAINYHFCKQYEEQMKGYAGFAEEMRKIQKQ